MPESNAHAEANSTLTERRPGPDSPTDLSRGSWWGVAKRTVKQFQADNLTDWAAALTYYGLLSIFPGLVVLVSSVGLLGDRTANTVLTNIKDLAPPPAEAILTPAFKSLQEAKHTAGVLAIVGLLGALWSASGYIGAFIRAANAIYDVPEGRPIWKTLPLRLALTVIIGVLLTVSVLAIVVTGRLAEGVGSLLHIGHTAVLVWDIAKWPVLLALISLMFALLYYLAPNAKHSGFRWITPGGVLAVVVWLVASVGFALYVANFNSYNKSYGTLGGVIAALVWLWISNVALLLGAEFDAELERGRAIAGGMRPADAEPYLPLRDDRKVDEPADGRKVDEPADGRKADEPADS